MALDSDALEYLLEIIQNQKTIGETLKIHGEWLHRMGEVTIKNLTALGEQTKVDADLYESIRIARTETVRLARACGFSIAFEGGGSAPHREGGA